MSDYIGGTRYQPAAAPDLGRGDEWADRAACAGMDPRLFNLAEQWEGLSYRVRYRDAKAVCARCPVRAECLATAIEQRSEGVRGGHVLAFGRIIKKDDNW